ncbi:MAG TPA: 6-phosphogluconolactonase [Marinobacter sp.]|nr:6-phosphogluconolactonase [Marinobacter sp.]
MKMPDFTLPDGVVFYRGDTPEQLADRLAATIAAELEQRLAVAPGASLVLSGGNTPVPLFHALREKPLDWSRLDVSLADERWVAETDARSNAALLREHLLQGASAQARFVPLKQPGELPEAALPAIERALNSFAWPPDVLVLGMGNDGHTASLFPDAPELPAALEDSQARVLVMRPPSQPLARVTLSPSLLASARFTALLIQGDDKLQTLARACGNPQAIIEMPVRLFLRPGLHIYWCP